MWIYDQVSGKLYAPNGAFVAQGYAGGNGGKNPEGINNHAMQHVKSIGPLPVGVYTFDQVVMQSKLGPFAIPLIPDSSNEMFGRGHFYVHGDTNPSGKASEGCMIQARAIRERMYNSDCKQIVVIG
jgi:hypothetical protein